MAIKRYQECNKFQKFWRRRWYLAIPFVAFYHYITQTKIGIDEEVDGKLVHTSKYELMSYRNWCKIAIGEMQIKMNFTYTQEEVEQHFKQWREKKDEKI